MKDYSATTGTAIQDDATEAGPFAYLPLAAITPSPANPRKTFTPARMAELVDSIRASGVHQPILVRPLPGSRVGETDRTVQHQVGPEAWDVLFTAKVAKPVTGKAVAEFQSFHVSELEVEAE